MYLLFFDFTFDADFSVYLPNAYIAQQKGKAWYFLKKATDSVLLGLPELSINLQQKEALVLVNSLQRTVLLQKFVKKGSSLEIIYKNITQKQLIQRYIEEKTDVLLEIIAKNEFITTLEYSSRDEIFKRRIQVSEKIIKPFLEFEKTNLGINYRLFLYDNDTKMIPSEQKIELLNNQKSWIVINRELMRVNHIKALNIKPFLNKTEVHIPEKMVHEYFDKFLKEILKKVEINAIGFNVLQKNSIQSSELRLVNDFFENRYKISVGFNYGGYVFLSNQGRISHSVLEVDENNAIQIITYKRDTSSEEKIYDLFRKIGFEEENGLFFVQKEGLYASVYHLLGHSSAFISENINMNSIEIEGKKLNKDNFELIFDNIYTENDWFDLKIHVKKGNNTFHFKELVKNIKENNPVYILPDGTVFLIPEEWFARYGTIVKFSKVNEGKLQLPKSNYALLNDTPELQPKQLINSVVYVPSPNLKATLRPYQKEGVQWLLDHHYNGLGACLADDMGLGKTLQTIALLVDIHDRLPMQENTTPTDLFDCVQQKEPLKALVILPSSLVFNWYDETKRFAPHLKCTQYVGNERKGKSNRLQNYDVIFTSYPIVTRDAKLFHKHEFRYVILDESQRIKNKNSQIFKAIHDIKATHKISLSGTPIENSLSDLWSQMQFINPNILGSFSQFSKYFKQGIEKKKDPIVLEELKTIIRPFLLRRTKEQVLDDLPELTEQITYCELSEAQEKWYEREKSAIRNQLLQVDGQISQLNALNMLMRLRQISNHPKLVEKNSDIPSGKYEEVISYMELIANSSQKALVFSSFVSHLVIFEQWCIENNLKYAKLTGSVPTDERKKEVEAFQNQPEVTFFFISLKAGEVGLNLTKASHVLLLDPWWNPFSEKQAIARAHRLGQKNKVNVIRFVSKNTIEEKIIRLQESKKELSQNIVDDTAIIHDVMQHIDEIL